MPILRCQECREFFETDPQSDGDTHHCLACCDCCTVIDADWYEAEMDQRLDLDREEGRR